MSNKHSILVAAAIGATTLLTGCGEKQDPKKTQNAVALLATPNNGSVEGRISMLSSVFQDLSEQQIFNYIVGILHQTNDKKLVFDELLKPENLHLLEVAKLVQARSAFWHSDSNYGDISYLLEPPVRTNLLKLNREDFQEILLKLVDASIISPDVATLYSTLYNASAQSTAPNAEAEVAPAKLLEL